MKIRKVGIAKARIKGLTDGNFKRDDTWLFYTTHIFLDQISSIYFKPLANIKCGNLFEESQKFHSKLIHQFDSIGIHNGDEVVVLFEKANSNIIAIGKTESNKWIDVNDYFKIKVFNDFNLFISDLTVY